LKAGKTFAVTQSFGNVALSIEVWKRKISGEEMTLALAFNKNPSIRLGPQTFETSTELR